MLKFKCLTAIIILMGISISENFSQEPLIPPKGRERMETAKKMKLLEILDLNESEADKFLIKYTAVEKTIKEKNEQLMKANEQLLEYIDSEPNGKDLSQKSNAVLQAQKELHSAIENKFSTMKTNLSDQNFAKFIAFDLQFTKKLRRLLLDKDKKGRPDWDDFPHKPRRLNK